MNIQESLQQIPDTVKIAVATGSSALTFLGIPVEQWMYILSAIVSLMFVIEKMPIVWERMKQLKRFLLRESHSSK